MRNLVYIISTLLFFLVCKFCYAWNIHIYDRKKAHVNKVDFYSYKTAICLFYNKFGKLPTKKEDLFETKYSERSPEEVLSKLDPWKNEYYYTPLGKYRFQILSFGSDAKEGGSGTAKDLWYVGEVSLKK